MGGLLMTGGIQTRGGEYYDKKKGFESEVPFVFCSIKASKEM